MYKVSNFKGMGTEWGKSQEIVQESGGSSVAGLSPLIMKSKGRQDFQAA